MGSADKSPEFPEGEPNMATITNQNAEMENSSDTADATSMPKPANPTTASGFPSPEARVASHRAPGHTNRQDSEWISPATAITSTLSYMLGSGRTERQLELEAHQHRRTMHTLQKRTAQLETVEAALQKETMMHSQTQLQLQQKQQEVDDVRKRWRDAANQLDAVMRQGQGVNQMTDDELIQKATALRFKVKNFALQFFGDEIKEPRMTQDAFNFLNNHLRLHLHSFKAYMLSSSFRPMLVRAFLWNYLQYKVFRNCGWAPHDESSAFMHMKWFLEPEDTNFSRVTPDSERKYHMWRANTSTLLLEASAQVEAGASDHRRKFSNGHVRKIYNALSLLSASDSQSIADRLEDIINHSVDLDAQFSQQVAVVQWETIKAPHSAWAFSPTWMEFERGQARTDIVPAIELVLAPALLKYGKSSGDGFETMATLLKLEATSESPLTT